MFLDDMFDYLTTSGITDTIRAGLMPDTPDNIVLLNETGGLPPTHTMSSTPGTPVMEQPGLQVICRSKNLQTARTMAHDVNLILNGFAKREINGITYHWAHADQSPFFLDRDENNREWVGCNYSVMKDYSTSTGI